MSKTYKIALVTTQGEYEWKPCIDVERFELCVTFTFRDRPMVVYFGDAPCIIEELP
jgi:hypothetical protein